jgi:polysaccharide pyruvyl transferase WcaK-like protein
MDAKGYISGMDFFIGSRMHSTIAAYSSGVPVVPLAYSRKFIGLFKDSLGYPYVGDMTKDNDDEIVRLVAHCFEDRHCLKEDIRENMDTKVEEYHQQFNTLLSELLHL